MARAVEADYLVVGAGAMGMAFADALTSHADVRVALVDRRHGVGGGVHRQELGEVFQGARRHVLELGGDRRASGCELVQRGQVVEGRLQMAISFARRGGVGIGVEHPDLVAHFMGGEYEEATELATAEHAQGGGRKDRRHGGWHGRMTTKGGRAQSL